jgi:general secretion pathway protein D
LRALYTGSETNVQLRPVAAEREPAGSTPPNSPPIQQKEPESAIGKGAISGEGSATSGSSKDAMPKAALHFEPSSANLKAGEVLTVKLIADNVDDLYSLPLLLEYDPKVIAVEDVRHGNFLSDGGREIAVVQQIDREQGHAIVSVTRPPNAKGVSGTGTVLEVLIRGLANGTSTLSLPAVNAKTSKHIPIDFRTDHATIRVNP